MAHYPVRLPLPKRKIPHGQTKARPLAIWGRNRLPPAYPPPIIAGALAKLRAAGLQIRRVCVATWAFLLPITERHMYQVHRNKRCPIPKVPTVTSKAVQSSFARSEISYFKSQRPTLFLSGGLNRLEAMTVDRLDLAKETFPL